VTANNKTQSTIAQLCSFCQGFSSSDLVGRTFVCDYEFMTGAEFIRRIRKVAGRLGIEVRWEARPGKGSHGRLFYGKRFTTVKDRKKEIGPGLLQKMLTDLGLRKDDIEE
jgi:hypothetical protein